jgi:hypothetical protein
MLIIEVRSLCPPNLHEFSTLPTEGAFAILCWCEKAIATGANGIVRVEVLA